MARFLFVVPPLAGHVNPAAAVARAVAARGHEVAWVGPASFLRPVLGPDAVIHRTGMRLYRDVRVAGMSPGLAFLNEYVLPLARFVRTAVDDAVAAFEPDVLVVDQHALAGALAAVRHGLPWASLLPSSMALGRYRPAEVDEWTRGPLARYCAELGLADLDPLAAMYSPHLQIAFTTTALTGPVELPPHAVLVGPALGERPDDGVFPLEWLDPAYRRVLVTVGTLNTDVAADFYRRAVEALDREGWRGVVVAPDGLLPEVPDRVRVVPRVPMLDVLPHVDAVVSHAGMNTVCEAALHGVPLVLAPITLDQPVTAEQVVLAGAGVRVDFAGASAAELRAALGTVLDDPAYRAASRRIGDSFRAAGGAATAAQYLESLAATDRNPALSGGHASEGSKP